jgi:hypothetical protein
MCFTSAYSAHSLKPLFQALCILKPQYKTSTETFLHASPSVVFCKVDETVRVLELNILNFTMNLESWIVKKNGI